MSNYESHDHNNTVTNSVSERGNESETAIRGVGLPGTVTVAESEPAGEPITIALAALGVAVPETVTVDVQFRSVGADHLILEIERRDDVYIVEGAGVAELTGVVGRAELPERVPDWITPVAELFGVEEVRLGR